MDHKQFKYMTFIYHHQVYRFVELLHNNNYLQYYRQLLHSENLSLICGLFNHYHVYVHEHVIAKDHIQFYSP